VYKSFGVGKKIPDFHLIIADKIVMRTEKSNPTVPIFKIFIQKPGLSTLEKKKGEDILGLMKGNLKLTQFILYDNGTSSVTTVEKASGKSKKAARRHYGTIINSIEKSTTHTDIYIPQVSTDLISSWPDTMKRKDKIAKELDSQQRGSRQKVKGETLCDITHL